MIRILAILAFVFITVSAAQAGDFPGDPGCKGYQCPNPGQPNPLPPPSNPVPVPQIGFCSGIFEGFYLGQPGPVAFHIVQGDQWGNLFVTAWWRGGMWYGQGICRQTGPLQAAMELYFPGAPVHRAVVNNDPRGFGVIDGQIDFGFFFRLVRRGW